jgi:hypothetical protein
MPSCVIVRNASGYGRKFFEKYCQPHVGAFYTLYERKKRRWRCVFCWRLPSRRACLLLLAAVALLAATPAPPRPRLRPRSSSTPAPASNQPAYCRTSIVRTPFARGPYFFIPFPLEISVFTPLKFVSFVPCSKRVMANNGNHKNRAFSELQYTWSVFWEKCLRRDFLLSFLLVTNKIDSGCARCAPRFHAARNAPWGPG